MTTDITVRGQPCPNTFWGIQLPGPELDLDTPHHHVTNLIPSHRKILYLLWSAYDDLKHKLYTTGLIGGLLIVSNISMVVYIYRWSEMSLLHHCRVLQSLVYMCRILTKRSGCRKKKKRFLLILINESVKKISVLAQIFTKLWPIYEFVSVAVSNNTYWEIWC